MTDEVRVMLPLNKCPTAFHLHCPATWIVVATHNLLLKNLNQSLCISRTE